MKAWAPVFLFWVGACSSTHSGPDSANQGGSSGIGGAMTAGSSAEAMGGASGSILLPELPTERSVVAKHWFDPDGISSVRSVTSRGDVVYLAGVPHGARIDLAARRESTLSPSPDTSWSFDSVAAPAGSSVLVAVLVRGESERLIRYSADDGASWQTASAPSTGASAWSRLSWVRSESGATRIFALYGGPTLDMSEDNGASWRRVVAHDDITWPAAGFAADASGKVLWAAGEAVLDKVLAARLDLGQSELASDWTQEIAYSESNGVYSAAADPGEPSAVYIGCEGRLGYLLFDSDGAFSIETPWTADLANGEPFTYVWAIWADPLVPKHVYFGGGDRTAIRLHESNNRGGQAQELAFETAPAGTLIGIVPQTNTSDLFLFVGSDGTKGAFGAPRVYVRAR